MKKRWGCVCLVLLLLFTACGGAAGGQAQQKENAVVVAISSEPESGFDPTYGWGHGNTPLVQSTLVEYNNGMEIVNDLATGYSVSEDGLVWRFTLRQDAYFTDGVQLTAEDVAFTFATAKQNASTLDLTYLVACEATGEFAVEFTLAAPMSTFINTLAGVGIVPQHAYSDDYASNPVGSGPWKLTQWNRGEQILLERNEDYYGEKPHLEKVTIVFMAEDAAFAAAQSGQVDVAQTSATLAGRDIAGMYLAQATTLDNRGFTLPVAPAGSGTTAEGYPVGNDVTASLAIRQALAYGINRDRLVADALNGYGDAAYSENDGMPWNNPTVVVETDVEYARQLLAADGWADTDGDGILEKDGLVAEFTCLYPGGDSVRQAVAMAAAEQARELGISIVVEGTSWDDISRRMFSEAVMMGWGAATPQESYFLYHSSGALQQDYYNPEGYASAATDAYLEAALAATDVDEAYNYWRLAQWDGETGTAMQGECPWVWLVNVRHLYYVREGLDIGTQHLHAHGASWTLLQNLREWKWSE